MLILTGRGRCWLHLVTDLTGPGLMASQNASYGQNGIQRFRDVDSP